MSVRRIMTRVSLVRVLYGIAAIAAPEPVVKTARLPPLDDDARYFNALFGGRDISVALATFAALRAGREREAIWINASCEMTDLAALIQEYRKRGALDASLIAGIAFNLGGQIAWVRAVRAL